MHASIPPASSASAPRSIDRIGNHHIRAHAAEGILFRRVLEHCARQHRLPCLAFTEAEVKAATPATMPMKDLARAAGPPWRIDERLACSAAWLALTR